MKVLVTGSTGLVGTRLLPRLSESGFECRVLIRPGKTAPDGVTVFEGDVLDQKSLIKAVEGVDAIVHLAAVLRTPDASQIWNVNLEGTRNLIAVTKQFAPNARFIMASTGLVYADSNHRPSGESDSVSSARDYPASKIAAEILLRESGLTWSILRFGFVYGDNDGHVAQIPHIAKLMDLHPSNRLSMIHHRDIANVVHMGLSGRLDEATINVVDESPMSVLELSNIAGSAMDTVDAPLAKPWFGVMDGSLARSLGFKPEVSTTWQAVREDAI
ncbi:MAG: NAD(P)-dependent oxidoreductase [Cytophagaceae bacterium]|nr:MAG: NAD(P)-dependent oxidoreductase [Cytophagaceae bacterium]